MKKKIIYAFLLVLSLTLIGCGSTNNSNQARSFGELEKVPAFSCQDLNGDPISNDIFSKNKLTMITIWTTT